ncbi:hypothetical protein [Pseudoalteromonas denitrificans]|uniref:Uncharacterized protein n=1 Tax=Pseudoalteromonas denitrificans DSM 6059 TaxID=1123010 RepID=A0A1I1I6Z8_9GAMM|nr:hypothetical protein [Pseudoalteromonas denitrificans]SFC31896.1 hypothetical protein SAMN02745724_01405 [Pseudoalteromonas denitrificans DSM 6059]
MLSTSYKTFLVMDQLRRKAGIPSDFLKCFTGLNQSTYSRISINVYEKKHGVLNYKNELNTLKTMKILSEGYKSKVISQTTLKRKRDVIADLKLIEKNLMFSRSTNLIDSNLDLLLEAADTLKKLNNL